MIWRNLRRKWKVQESMHIWFIACRFFICYPSTYVYQNILKHLTAYFITLHVSEPSIISSIQWRCLFKYNNDGSRSVFRVTLRLFKRRKFGTSKATIINSSKLNEEFLNGYCVFNIMLIFSKLAYPSCTVDCTFFVSIVWTVWLYIC